ncbi:tRNA pseudouridine synthase A [Trichuris trichiura]|uniref:tRNA pseudouridine synthase n=1 Tax=Trichuris trichiura TaxID=36087 RepID=A0A077ZH79_TRITR|nr:tRNA pseudouridine synthase A [Trichuris trichiura]
MFRYFLSFSYLGSRFAGCQFQPDNITVQGVLEFSLVLFLYLFISLFSSVLGMVFMSPLDKEPRLRISSRTDSGVHALMNTATFDVELEKEYEPNYLKAAINTLLCKLEMEIRILDCRTVSLGFDARRHARERTYLYRLAVLKDSFDEDEDYVANSPEHQLPILEYQRVWALRSNFDIQRFCSAAEAFVGWHNFASFMSKSKNRQGELVVDSERTVKHIGVKLGRPLLDRADCPFSDRFNFFDVTFISKSFLYNQIRRMMACLVATATNRMEVKDIKWLLENPDPANYSKFNLRKAPSAGLFLKNIHYDESDFLNPNPFYSIHAERDTSNAINCDRADSDDNDE